MGDTPQGDVSGFIRESDRLGVGEVVLDPMSEAGCVAGKARMVLVRDRRSKEGHDVCFLQPRLLSRPRRLLVDRSCHQGFRVCQRSGADRRRVWAAEMPPRPVRLTENNAWSPSAKSPSRSSASSG
jgi:hypothetical protein